MVINRKHLRLNLESDFLDEHRSLVDVRYYYLADFYVCVDAMVNVNVIANIVVVMAIDVVFVLWNTLDRSSCVWRRKI